MTKPAAIFRASYSDWKLIRTRKCVQLVFEVPLEESNKAYEALGGMPNSGEEAWVAIARLNPETVKEVMPADTRNISNSRTTNDTQSREEVMPDRESPTKHDTSPASGPDIQARARKKTWREMAPSQQAALLCKSMPFRQFLSKEFHCTIMNEEEAAIAVRHTCKVDSRSDIKSNTESARLFDLLYNRFVTWRDADIYVEASA